MPQDLKSVGLNGVLRRYLRYRIPTRQSCQTVVMSFALKETDTCLPTSTCALPFPVVFPRVSGFPAFFSHGHPSTSESASLFEAVPSHASTLPASSSRVIDRPPTFTSSSAFPVGSSRLQFAFFSCSMVILIFYVPLRVILFHILMLTPFQHTSTLLVQCTPTPHKPWARLAPLITPPWSAILALVLKLHFLPLKTHVTFHLLLSRWVNVFLKPLLPQWRK